MGNHLDQKTITEQQQARNTAHTCLRERQPLKNRVENPQKNSTCDYETVEEEIFARNTIVTDQIKIIKSQLPGLLKHLSKTQEIPKKSNTNLPFS